MSWRLDNMIAHTNSWDLGTSLTILFHVKQQMAQQIGPAFQPSPVAQIWASNNSPRNVPKIGQYRTWVPYAASKCSHLACHESVLYTYIYIISDILAQHRIINNHVAATQQFHQTCHKHVRVSHQSRALQGQESHLPAKHIAGWWISGIQWDSGAHGLGRTVFYSFLAPKSGPWLGRVGALRFSKCHHLQAFASNKAQQI